MEDVGIGSEVCPRAESGRTSREEPVFGKNCYGIDEENRDCAFVY